MNKSLLCDSNEKFREFFHVELFYQLIIRLILKETDIV
jgi:hypothetical protein